MRRTVAVVRFPAERGDPSTTVEPGCQGWDTGWRLDSTVLLLYSSAREQFAKVQFLQNRILLEYSSV